MAGTQLSPKVANDFHVGAFVQYKFKKMKKIDYKNYNNSNHN